MRRPLMTRLLGIILAAFVTLSIGSRPPIHAGQMPTLIPTATIGGAFGGGGGDDKEPSPAQVYLAAPPLTVAQIKVRLKLQEKIPMHFPTDTPLEDVKKYIEESTKDQADFPDGLTIYVDPQGLQDSDKTMASTIAIDLKAQPLEKTLRLVLKQLDLTFDVDKDGLLVINSIHSDDESGPVDVDRAILADLSALRSEVRMLRQEIGLLRGHAAGPEAAKSGSPR